MTRLTCSIQHRPPATACPYKVGNRPWPMRVLIADDHEIMRKSISSILQSRTDVRICGEAANGKEAVSKTQLLNPDLLILDISFLAGFERMIR